MTRRWPEPIFLWPEVNPKFFHFDPKKNLKTRDPTRVQSKNPKPDPRREKLTRPIPTVTTITYPISSHVCSLSFSIWDTHQEMAPAQKMAVSNLFPRCLDMKKQAHLVWASLDLSSPFIYFSSMMIFLFGSSEHLIKLLRLSHAKKMQHFDLNLLQIINRHFFFPLYDKRCLFMQNNLTKVCIHTFKYNLFQLSSRSN